METPDGSLFFDTRIGVDIVNIKKTIENSFKRIRSSINNKFTVSIGADTRESDTKLEELERQYKEKLEHIENLKKQEYVPDDMSVSPEMQAEIEKADDLKLKIAEAKDAVAKYRQEWVQGNSGADKAHADSISALQKLKNEYQEACDNVDKLMQKEDALRLKEREAFESNRLKELTKEQTALDKLKVKIDNYRAEIQKTNVEGDQAVSVFGKLQKRILGLAKRVFIFSVITAALRKIRKLFAEYAKENEPFNTALSQVKGNLLISFQILYEKIMPILTLIMQIVARITDQVAKFMVVLAGKDYEQVKQNAKALYEQAKATNATGKAAKKAKRELAGFDKLNNLGDKTDSNEDKTEPSFDYSDSTDKATKMKIDNILKYTAILMGFAMVLIGIFTFNIPMIIAGGLLLAWGLTLASTTETPTWIDMVLSWGLMIVGVAILLIGIFTGNLALMIAGVLAVAVGYAYGTASNSFTETPTWVSQIVSYGLMVVGVALLLIGIFTANIPMIIAGIIALAVGMSVGSTSGAFDSTPMWVNQIITYGLMVIGVVMIIIGIATANIPLLIAGVALLGVGIAYGAKTGVFKALWEQLKNLKDDIVNLVKNFFAWVSEKWSGFKDKASKAMAWLHEHLTLKNLFNGYISYLEWLINTVVKGVNALTGLLNKVKFDVPDWVPAIGGKTLGFNIPQLNEVSLPKLATGTVVPAHYGEFLSILGDNKREPEVISPVSTMKQAFKEALAESGSNGGLKEIHVHLDVDKEEMASVVVDGHNEIVKRTGKSPLKGV